MGVAERLRLIETKHLYDAKKSGQKVKKTGLSQGQVSPKSGSVKALNGAPALAYNESSQTTVDYAHHAL